jgi:hypothetical protein
MVSAWLNVHHQLLTHGCQQHPKRIRCKVRTATHREISHTTAPTIGIDQPMLYRVVIDTIQRVSFLSCADVHLTADSAS